MSTITSVTLLEGLRDNANQDAWGRFDARYRPMILAFCRKLGLSPQDAEDVAQETLVTFLSAYREGRYEREKGRLKSWLFGMAQFRIGDFRRRVSRKEQLLADRTDVPGFLANVADPNTISRVWEEEWSRAVLRECMERVRQETDPVNMQAFELYTLQDWDPQRIADHLGITRQGVYRAKNRIMDRIKRLEKEIGEIW
jgi:RNA polymerase sigma-70 factor, ECF subfamily